MAKWMLFIFGRLDIQKPRITTSEVSVSERVCQASAVSPHLRPQGQPKSLSEKKRVNDYRDYSSV
jgi:hypothetical protein